MRINNSRPNSYQVNLFNSLILDAQLLSIGDKEGIARLMNKTKSAVKQLFGPFSDYVYTLKMIRFFPRTLHASEEQRYHIWIHGIRSYIDLMQTILNDISQKNNSSKGTQHLNREINEHLSSMLNHSQTVIDLTHRELRKRNS